MRRLPFRQLQFFIKPSPTPTRCSKVTNNECSPWPPIPFHYHHRIPFLFVLLSPRRNCLLRLTVCDCL
ncbi:Protein of unknown function [Pyronema omphalodes CBS 100304]|uniref:Uncharacterized protein n=1 Tax=Pyronema omphalodes (strain CBS 100304) TaxID=1076935 RepID=U4LUG4_PYROM|nr:Protein of unknown function [Pyronema omphalodes CBS 100304]